MVQVRWTRSAKEDLRGIYEYISRDSNQYAKLQVLRIRNRVLALENQPNLGQRVPELERADIRQLVEGSYRIIYRVIDKVRIDILTIHHSSRDFGRRTEEFK